ASVDQVSVGSVVEVRIPDGTTSRYTILGGWDGDPEHHVISYKTPLGAALIGRRAGETVKVKTGVAEESYSIVSIERYARQAPARRFRRCVGARDPHPEACREPILGHSQDPVRPHAPSPDCARDAR